MKKAALTVFIIVGLAVLGIGAQIYLAPTEALSNPRDPGPPSPP